MFWRFQGEKKKNRIMAQVDLCSYREYGPPVDSPSEVSHPDEEKNHEESHP
jgi:hypothetical protein